MSDTNTDDQTDGQEDEFPYPTSTTSESASTMSAENLIKDKHQAITREYEQLKYKAEHELPTRIAAVLLTKVILPAFITIFLFNAFNPLIITAPVVLFWIFQLYAPTKYKESLKNGYQINPDNANESEQLLYDLFTEICNELGYNPDNYNLIIHNSAGIASAEPNTNTLYITTETIEELSKTELKSVIAHELTHTNHNPLLTKLYTFTTIPTPLIAYPLVTLATVTPFIAFTVTALAALIRTIAKLTLGRQMELESDNAIPQHYHHHYAHALTQISEHTPHIQSPLGRRLYSFIDSHAPLNERIETIINIDLPTPTNYHKPTIRHHIKNILATTSMALISIGLLEYFLTPNYAIATGAVVALICINNAITAYLPDVGDDTNTRPSIGIATLKSFTFLIFIPLGLYALAVYLTNSPLLPPTLDPHTTATYALQTVGHFINQIIIALSIGFIILATVGLSTSFYGDDTTRLDTDTIFNDTHHENTLRDHYK